MDRGKRGQESGSSAAALVLVIASFILLYLLFLPTSDRDELLGSSTGTVGSGSSIIAGAVLLDERPGTLTNIRQKEFEHNIPSFNLFTEKEDLILKSTESIFVDSKDMPSRTVPVFIDGTVENAKLSFAVADHSGILTVTLNDEQIFKGELSGAVEPLTLTLQDENIITYSVDSPASWEFWKNNFYDIRNAQVTGTVERVRNRESLSTFFMSKEEANIDNIQDAYIVYLADCQARTAGTLSVYLNDALLSSKSPDCGSLEKTFIDPSDFNVGRNELRFETDEGKFLIDRIFVKVNLKEAIFPVFFFDINSTQYERVQNDTINASVFLEFVDDREQKTGTLELNSHRIFFNTKQNTFAKNIDPFILKGSNSLRIVPETTLQVTKISVEVDCKRVVDCR